MAMLTLNVFIGGMFVIALNNAVNLEIDSRLLAIAIVSTAPTFFILWLTVMLIVNPIYIMLVATKSKTPITQSLLLYLQKRKKEAIITGLIFAVFALIIFVFIAITLTVTQSLTIKTWEELNSEDQSQDER
jgi:magnesium-transporting ATPase (P-type)